jgi:AraC family transcriptional regulator
MRRSETEPAPGAIENREFPFPGNDALFRSDSKFVGICHGDPRATTGGELSYDACVTVDDGFRADREIGVQTIPGGDYAVIRHVGPYRTLAKTYALLLGRWLPQSGRELGSTPCFEVYLNSPYSVAPEELVTDIYVPLRPAPARMAPAAGYGYELQSA